MPTINIHEKVGYEIGKKVNLHSYDYYLGLLAPDAPNLKGFAPKEERWMAHQRREDYDDWRDALHRFYQQEKDHYPREFLLGYFIHILTDIVYDDFFYLKVREKILNDYSLEESHQVMRNDMEKYRFLEMSMIQDLLKKNHTSYDILNISSKELSLWKEKQISLFQKETSCDYITEDIINALVDEVYKELLMRIEP
ncbi:MAG: hypothetical protein IKF71_03010 [Bacilli bacterium]|nr:hypothetical protein [Bacilli bacterium]